MLNRALNVPVGLICTAWGGTRIEPWISEAGLGNFDWVKLPDKTIKQENLSPQTPTVLFNGMVKPIAGFGIRGAIWYQGESNAGRAYQYRHLFPKMINNWRQDWKQGDFPFYFVQLANFMHVRPATGRQRLG